MKPRLLILGTPGPATNILFHALLPDCLEILVITESPQSKLELVRRRLRRLGWPTVVGQLFFQMMIQPVVHSLSGKRWNSILREKHLNAAEIPNNTLQKIASANSKECVKLIQKFQPDLVLLSGTRILKKEVLDRIACPVVNIHAGITPAYRGVHGAYWALINNDIENCGVTLHFVDSGIDTGEIIDQSKITPSANDNFSTYPLLQVAAGIEMLKKHLRHIVSGEVKTQSTAGESRLWYHPTAFTYLKNRWLRGVK